jgi:hypothetical protein
MPRVVDDGPQPLMHGYASADGGRTAFIFTEEGRTWRIERWQGKRLLSITKGLSAAEAKWAGKEWTR